MINVSEYKIARDHFQEIYSNVCGANWDSYPNQNAPINGKEIINMILQVASMNHLSTNVPNFMLNAFTKEDLSEIIQFRREEDKVTNYLDLFGPGHFHMFKGEEKPDLTYAIHANDYSAKSYQEASGIENIHNFHMNLYNFPKIRSIEVPTGGFNIITSIPIGAFQNRNFQIEGVSNGVLHNYHLMMFKKAYNVCSEDNGLMIFQFPQVNRLDWDVLSYHQMIFLGLLDDLRIPHIHHAGVILLVKIPKSVKTI